MKRRRASGAARPNCRTVPGPPGRRNRADPQETRRLIVLGLNAFGHDAAAVLLVDGRVAFAASEERFDRERHSAAFPAGAIAQALASTGVAAKDVDAIAFPWTRGMARVRKALHVATHLPRSIAFLREPPDVRLPSRGGYLREMRTVGRRLRDAGFVAPLRRVPHHTAHAASAALVLPDATGLALTADGMGEWTTAATWTLDAGVPRRLREATYPHSPGKAYAAVTSWLGFVPESDEGKTMGLAAHGDPHAPAAAFARALLSPDDRRLLRVDLAKLGFPWGESRLYGDAFVEALGPARRPEEALRPSDASVARGIQDAVETMALQVAHGLLREQGPKPLGLAGGLFLNCAMNGRLARELDVPVLPFPAAGDSGAALGAAALVHRMATGRPASPLGTLRLGREISDAEARATLEPRGARRLEAHALAAEVAARVAKGSLVAVARGRGEFGPRALGGRSVLARADEPAVKDRLNAHKGREAWRPVAPVVRADDLSRWFDPPFESPWMILTLRVRPEAARGPLRGAVHADGTARVQSVTSSTEPFLHAVIGALAPHGQHAVLNTSLNRRGEPIVDTAAQALDAALAMRLDAIVVGDWLLDLGVI